MFSTKPESNLMPISGYSDPSGAILPSQIPIAERRVNPKSDRIVTRGRLLG